MEAQLSKAFQLTSVPDTQAIKDGENILHNLKNNPAYPLALLDFLNNQQIQSDFKLRAAIELKLWCQQFKKLEPFERDPLKDISDQLKNNMLEAYLTFPLQLSKSLRPGVVALVDVLFPNQWHELLQSVLAYGVQNQNGINAVLKLLQSISFKYTYESRSDPLYEEIIIVCDEVHGFLLELAISRLQNVLQNPNDQSQVVTLEILLKIFYNLNYQDLHPHFEDNIANWMNILKQVMGLQNTNQTIIKCKGAALEAILLYSNKYKEDVGDLIKDFCTEIWQLCSQASGDSEYDDVVFNCLKFFKSLMMWPDMKGFFQQNFQELFPNLIIPNVGLNMDMLALFQGQVDLFIDYYFKNAQIQTKRAASLDVLRVICRQYSHLFEPFLQKQIQSFESVSGDIDKEISLLNLIIDGSSKGFRDIDGCTQLFVNTSFIQYTYQQIIKKRLLSITQWISNNQGTPIEKQYQPIYIATILRFIFYFKIFLPKNQITSLLTFFTSIKTQKQYLNRIIYLAINGLLLLRHGDFVMFRNFQYFFRGEPLREVAVNVLKVVYEGTCREQRLQEPLTKMLYNMTRSLGSLNAQFFEYQIEIVKEMLKRTINYQFIIVHFLFESMGEMAYHLIKVNSPHRSVLQSQIMTYFMQYLSSKSDLVNFCLQILAIYLQLQHNTNQQYINIYNSLLMTQNWKQDNQSLMPSYIQFLIAFIAKHREKLIENKSAVEVILSKIIEIDHVELFYRFLEAIMINTRLEEFYQSGYLSIAIQGGPVVSRTLAGRKASLLFINKLIVYYDTAQCLQLINQCCQQYYDQLLQANLDIIETLTHRPSRKTLFTAICKTASLGYFGDSPLLPTLINALITNTSGRFNINNISKSYIQQQQKEKKESTYQKLFIFKQFERQPEQLQVVEEEILLSTFKTLNNQYPNFADMITPNNRTRLSKINDNLARSH